MQRRSNILSCRAMLVSLCAIVNLVAGCSSWRAEEDQSHAATQYALHVPVDYYQLSNGLRVVLSEDHTTPTVTVGVYYNIGSRIEPTNRTGFAHLFEHLMLQGSQQFPKDRYFRLIEGLGGMLNGMTRDDYTSYYTVVPSNALETVLRAEAARMQAPNFTEQNLANQQGVVKEEIKINVLNQPYGGFPWLQLPQYANQLWANAHDSYGDLQHIDAATLNEVQRFFETYYVPRNAVLVVLGDFAPTSARAWIQRHFSEIRDRPAPTLPDVTEPRQTVERRAAYIDQFAPRPALAMGYHVPPRWTPEYFALGLIDQILVQGETSRLYRTLVQDYGYTDRVTGGINNKMGNMFTYQGSVLWSFSLIHDSTTTATQITTAIDKTIEALRTQRLSRHELDRARRMARSRVYDAIDSKGRTALADLLACFALFDNDPSRVNRIDSEFSKVTPELILETAQRYLRRENRTMLVLQPSRSESARGANP